MKCLFLFSILFPLTIFSFLIKFQLLNPPHHTVSFTGRLVGRVEQNNINVGYIRHFVGRPVRENIVRH